MGASTDAVFEGQNAFLLVGSAIHFSSKFTQSPVAELEPIPISSRFSLSMIIEP